MKTILNIALALSIALSASTTFAITCGNAGRVWSPDTDGSIRLTYVNTADDLIELIQRPKDDITIARGYINDQNQELYAVYDHSTGNLIYALGEPGRRAVGTRGQLPAIYAMQSYFDIEVYSATPKFREEISALLSQNKSLGCDEEIKKRLQGRTPDMQRCGETLNGLNALLEQFARPQSENFQNLTANQQVQKFVERFRLNYVEGKKTTFFTDRNDPDNKHNSFCIGIQKMDMLIAEKMRKPDTLKTLETKKKMPGYLDEPRDYQKTTTERYNW